MTKSARGPELAAGIAVLALAVFAGWTGMQVTAVVLDEAVYKFAASQYANGLGAILDDNTSRGLARLYSLLITPIFVVFEGDVAVRVARAFNGLLWAATALPVFALALRAGATRAGASLAAAGAVVLPWATLSAILFSEALAYLLFACTALAMLRLLEAPSWRREVLVLGLLGALVLTRMQFLVVVVAWIAYLAFDRLRARPRVMPWRPFPLTFGLVGLAFLVLLVRPRTVTGPYYEIQNRQAYNGDFGLAALWEVEMLALGVGVIPVMLAAAWFGRAQPGAVDARARAVARLGAALVAAVFVGTLLAQSGFLDFRAEERYFIYAIPFVWAGAAGALALRDLPVRWVAWAGVGLAIVFALVPNPVGATGEQIFLGPVSAVSADVMPGVERRFNDLLGVTGAVSRKDFLALLALALTAIAVLGLRRGGLGRWVMLVPALALQLAIAAYAFTGIHGGLTNVGGITGGAPFADLGWVDRTTGGGPDVRLLDNIALDREFAQRGSVFWNDEVTTFFGVPELGAFEPTFPVGTIPTAFGRLAEPLRFAETPPGDLLMSAVDSPLWQVASREVHRSPDGRTALVEPTADLQWVAKGLDTDGHLTKTAELAARGGTRVAIELVEPRDDQQALVTVKLGDETVDFDSTRTRRQVARFDLCGETGVVRGALELRGAVEIAGRRYSGAFVPTVRVTPCR